MSERAAEKDARPEGCLGTDAIPCTPDFTCVACVARELGVRLASRVTPPDVT